MASVVHVTFGTYLYWERVLFAKSDRWPAHSLFQLTNLAQWMGGVGAVSMSGLGYHSWGHGCYGHRLREDRGASKHPLVHRTATTLKHSASRVNSALHRVSAILPASSSSLLASVGSLRMLRTVLKPGEGAVRPEGPVGPRNHLVRPCQGTRGELIKWLTKHSRLLFKLIILHGPRIML